MTCTFDIELGDYADDTLSADARAAVEAHLASCGRCHAVVADLRALHVAARALEPQAPPPQVWTRLSARLEQGPRRRRFSLAGFTWRPVAAAAMLMVIATSLSWLGGRLSSLSTPPSTVATTGAAAEPVVTADAELQEAERQFTEAIAGLEQIAGPERDSLDRETADVLRVNLTVIDDAIGESRSVLREEPDNELAVESLFEALRRKVALLQDIVTLINEMRQGNQEGAARILSGFNQ